jgi:uncharacterized protein
MYPPNLFRLQGAYLRLEGQSCSSCGAVQFPARATCRKCRSSSLSARPLSGRGSVESFTELTHAPNGFSSPCLIALVRLDEGITIASQLTDVSIEQVAIGMPVEAVTRRIRELGPEGCVVYAYKFRPITT